MSVAELAALPTAGRWEIDGVHSTVAFAVRHHAVATFRAAFADIAGAYDADADRLDGQVAAAAVVISGADRLYAHLQTASFFDAESHPSITFTAEGLRGAAAADTATTTGELTLRGVTRPILTSFSLPGGPREVTHGDGHTSERFGLDLATTIDRREFGMEHNNFVAEGVYNLGWEVRIEASLELTRATTD